MVVGFPLMLLLSEVVPGNVERSGPARGVGFWCSFIRAVIPLITFVEAVRIWVHAEPPLRSMSAKIALRRSGNCWPIRHSSQNANVWTTSFFAFSPFIRLPFGSLDSFVSGWPFFKGA